MEVIYKPDFFISMCSYYYDLPGSLGEKENMKEYLIILDACEYSEYTKYFF